jgi:hypothetical protein
LRSGADERDDYDEPDSRYPRYGGDEPRYRAGRRSGGGYRSARHAYGVDEDDEPRRTARGSSRQAVTAYAGPRRGENVITPRSSGTRGGLGWLARRPEVDDEDDEQEGAYGYAGAGFASVAWFGLPLGAFLAWAVLLGGTARADCVDAGGRPCPAPREAAFSTFTAHLPQVGVAIVLSVIVALLIRLVSPFWRAATVGFAASVVGAGVTTVVFTVLNGGSP